MDGSAASAGPGEQAAGIYLHIPFCRTKCHYCDFNTYAGIENLIPDYVDALAADIRRGARDVDQRGRRIVSIFFGGGTPSLLDGAHVGRLLQAVAQAWRLAPEPEVSLEANPGTLTAGALHELRAAGVNRVSFGVQSLEPRGLAALGREHSDEDARQAVASARAAGLTNINLDLIYGWPGQTTDDWEEDLTRVIALGPPHLSLYPLTVEHGTPLAAMVRRGQVRVADDDEMADRYDAAVERLAKAGYVQYEVSNWALADGSRPDVGPGATPHLACRHNLLYWRNEEYWGGGPGAHSSWAGHRWMTLRSPRRYIELVHRGDTVITQVEEIAPALAMAETMFLGLRLAEGVSMAAFQQRHGRMVWDEYGTVLAALLRAGQIEEIDGHLVIPPAQRYLLDGIVAQFLPTAPSIGDAAPIESTI